MSRIQVYLKLRQGAGNPSIFSRDPVDPCLILLSSSKGLSGPTSFSFDAVFDHDASEAQIYNTVLQDLVANLPQHSSTLFTLGPANSGKSHTLFRMGLVPHALKDLFSQLERLNGSFDSTPYHEALGTHYGGLLLNANDIFEGKGAHQEPQPRTESSPETEKYIVSLLMFELFNDTVSDMLEITKDYAFLKKQLTKQSRRSGIFSDCDGKVRPAGLFSVSVGLFEQAQLLVAAGMKTRRGARSHIFIHVNVHAVSFVKQKASFGQKIQGHPDFPNRAVKIRTSRLTIADLAAGERSSMTSRSAFLENAAANQLLSELGRVLTLLCKSKSRTKEKYLVRSDKLTRLLLSDFVGAVDSRMAVLVALDPCGDARAAAQTLRLIEPLPQFKNGRAGANVTKASPFNFRLGFKTRARPATSIRESILLVVTADSAEALSVALRRLSMSAQTPPHSVCRDSLGTRDGLVRNSQAILVAHRKPGSPTLSSTRSSKTIVASLVPTPRSQSAPQAQSAHLGAIAERSEVAYRCQALSDENKFLKGRNTLLEKKMKDLEETHKDLVRKMAQDLSGSRVELDTLLLKNSELEERLKLSEAAAAQKERLLKDYKNRLQAKENEVRYLKSELNTVMEDLERIKHKFTVVTYQNHELQQQYSQLKEKQKGQRNSKNSTASNSNLTLEGEVSQNGDLLFCFDEFAYDTSLQSAYNKVVEKDLTIEPIRSTSDVTNNGNLTSNSSAIFDYDEIHRTGVASISNSQYGSESDT